MDLPYASPAALFRDELAVLRSRGREPMSQYVTKNRFLANATGGYSGLYSHDLAPYLAEPMDCLTSPEIQTVAVVGPGQAGKSTIAENWLLKSVHNDPADLLWYMQTDDAVEAYVKSNIDALIDLHPAMASRLGRKPVDRSLHFKRFAGMRAEFLAATHANLISKRAPRIVADEIDAWLASLGDVKALLDVRMQTFGRAGKLLAMSHPDRTLGLDPDNWSAGIMALYRDSDRRVFYWPCPDCGGWSSPVPIADRYMPIWYPPEATLDEIERETRLVCPCSGCMIEDSYRREMARYGRWVARGQVISEDGTVTGERMRTPTAGFWIVGAMSLLNRGIGSLARARVKAERESEVSGETAGVRQVMAKQWGVPATLSKREGSVDADVLVERTEPGLRLGVVPVGARFLTVAADVQATHFEWLVRAWGVKGESWVVAWGRLPANVDTSAEDWDALFETAFGRAWPLADRSGRSMLPRGCGYDSAGIPGVTEQAYAAFTRWQRARKLRMNGSIGGRDAWSVIPMKGAKAVGAQRLVVSYPDTQRKANKLQGRGNVPVATFNPNLFKDALSGQLKTAEVGPGYLHFPAELKSREPPHTFFEQITSEHRLADGRWEKKSPNSPNEKLDLLVMTHALASLHGLSRITWEAPPSWASEWDVNPMVIGGTPPPVQSELLLPLASPLNANPAAASAVVRQPNPAQPGARLASRLA